MTPALVQNFNQSPVFSTNFKTLLPPPKKKEKRKQKFLFFPFDLFFLRKHSLLPPLFGWKLAKLSTGARQISETRKRKKRRAKEILSYFFSAERNTSRDAILLDDKLHERRRPRRKGSRSGPSKRARFGSPLIGKRKETLHAGCINRSRYSML